VGDWAGYLKGEGSPAQDLGGETDRFLDHPQCDGADLFAESAVEGRDLQNQSLRFRAKNAGCKIDQPFRSEQVSVRPTGWGVRQDLPHSESRRPHTCIKKEHEIFLCYALGKLDSQLLNGHDGDSRTSFPAALRGAHHLDKGVAAGLMLGNCTVEQLEAIVPTRMTLFLRCLTQRGLW
jgi:hypothetical protein